MGGGTAGKQQRVLYTSLRKSSLLTIFNHRFRAPWASVSQRGNVNTDLMSVLLRPGRHTGGAPAHLSVTLYTELLASKDVVLVRADIVNDQTVSVPEVRLALVR